MPRNRYPSYRRRALDEEDEYEVAPYRPIRLFPIFIGIALLVGVALAFVFTSSSPTPQISTAPTTTVWPPEMDMTSENHSWWDATRARPSITTDLGDKGVKAAAITWSTQTTNALSYLIGGGISSTDSNWYVEMETFVGGKMYKVTSSAASSYGLSDLIDQMTTGYANTLAAPTPTADQWAQDASGDTYVRVNDHPESTKGDKIKWECVIVDFLGNDANNSANIDIGCREFTDKYYGLGDGEIILNVPPSFDTNSMDSGDHLTVYGVIGDPIQGKTRLGVQSSWVQIHPVYLVDHGKYQLPSS